MAEMLKLPADTPPQPCPGVYGLQKAAGVDAGSCTRHLWQCRLQRGDEMQGFLRCGLLWYKCQELGVGERRQKKGDEHIMLKTSDVRGEL